MSSSTRRALVRSLGNPRVTVPLLLFTCVVLLSLVQRAVVLAGHHERLATVASSQLVRSFAVGLRFDCVVAGLITLPALVVVAVAPPGWLARRGFQWTVAGLCAVLLAVACFAGIADYYFFSEFDERLNHKALHYLDQPYTYRVIWNSYPVVWVLLATLLVLAGGAWAFRRLAFRRTIDDFQLRGRLLWPAALALLLTVAIRGSLGPKALNAGPAYFSGSPTLAQLTLNPLYTLREAALSATYRSEDLADHLHLLPVNEAFDLTKRLIFRPEDRSANDPANPMRRVTDTAKPQGDYNVVLVVLESLSWHYVGPLGGDARLTPNFNKLCDEGILMTHCFSVGDRTTRGFAGIVCGHPDLPGRSITTRIETAGNFLTLGRLLQRRGYQTMFLYAGQPMYDHRQSFLRSNGYEHLVFEDQFERHTFRTELGWCDEDLYNEAIDQFSRIGAAGGRPFHAALLTLSFHRPYHIPPGRIPPLNFKAKRPDHVDAIRYTDWALQQFMDRARQQPWFDKTLFVLVADHAGGYAEYPVDATDYRVPFLLYGPKILGETKQVNSICSQTDVIPTVMGILGGKYEHSCFGSNVLTRPADAGMALLQRSSGQMSLIDHDGAVVHIPFGGQTTLSRFELPDRLVPSTAPAARRDELARRAIAILQSANAVFERGVYNVR